MKLYIALFLMILLTSCISQNIVGTYSSQKFSDRFTLMADSSYNYEYHRGFRYEYSSGNWKVVKRKLILQSYLTSKLIELDVKEKTDAKLQNGKINIGSIKPPR